jgi:hypothetical protein
MQQLRPFLETIKRFSLSNETFYNTHITRRSNLMKFTLRPSVPSSALCPLYCPLPPLRPSVRSTVLCLLYGSQPPSTALYIYCPQYSIALCPFYGPPSPLRPSVTSTAHSLLHGPLSPLRLSVPSTALCPLYALFPRFSPLSPLWRSVSPYTSVPSTATCPLCGSLSRPTVSSTTLCPFYGRWLLYGSLLLSTASTPQRLSIP